MVVAKWGVRDRVKNLQDWLWNHYSTATWALSMNCYSFRALLNGPKTWLSQNKWWGIGLKTSIDCETIFQQRPGQIAVQEWFQSFLSKGWGIKWRTSRTDCETILQRRSGHCLRIVILSEICWVDQRHGCSKVRGEGYRQYIRGLPIEIAEQI